MYPMSSYPVLAHFVASGYHQVDVVDGVVIYARNSSSSPNSGANSG